MNATAVQQGKPAEPVESLPSHLERYAAEVDAWHREALLRRGLGQPAVPRA